MYPTNEELLNAIRLGEDSSLELKAVVFSGSKIKGPGRDELAEEMAAFANAKGGVIVLGVDDKSRDINGIPMARLEEVETLVRDVANDSIDPPLYLDIHRIELPDALGNVLPVIRVDIDKSLFVHAAKGKYLYRVGSSKRPMAPDYLARLMQQRSQARLIRFDEQVVPNASWESFAPELVSRYRTDRSDLDEQVYLRKMSMVGEDQDGVLRPTVCGVLMGTASPQQYLPNAFIQAVAYRGAQQTALQQLSAYQLDQQDITGPLDAQVRGALQFIARNMRIGGSKSAGRSDVPQYDLTAVFEALVNAVAHRDYSIYASKIRLRVYSDCLQLFVPGALSNSMEVASLPLRQATRNEAISSLLARTPVDVPIEGFHVRRDFMMDKRGEGVNLILDRSEKLSGKRPVYELIDESELMLTIFAAEVAPSSSSPVNQTGIDEESTR